MAKHVQQFTHKGWFGICPIYIADIETDCPALTPRVENWFFETLFWISHYMFVVVFAVADFFSHLMHSNWRMGFPICVTGELLVPYLYEYDDAENPR